MGMITSGVGQVLKIRFNQEVDSLELESRITLGNSIYAISYIIPPREFHHFEGEALFMAIESGVIYLHEKLLSAIQG